MDLGSPAKDTGPHNSVIIQEPRRHAGKSIQATQTRVRPSGAGRGRIGTYRQPALQPFRGAGLGRSEEHTSELQSLMRISYAVFCLKKNKHIILSTTTQIKNKQHKDTSTNN